MKIQVKVCSSMPTTPAINLSLVSLTLVNSLSPVSLTSVINTKVQISLRIFEKIWNCLIRILRGRRKLIHEKTWSYKSRVRLPLIQTSPPQFSYNQGCEWNDKSANRERESRTRIGSDATLFLDSLSNLVIDDNFRISNNLGLGLAANISTALGIQPDRDRE